MYNQEGFSEEAGCQVPTGVWGIQVGHPCHLRPEPFEVRTSIIHPHRMEGLWPARGPQPGGLELGLKLRPG